MICTILVLANCTQIDPAKKDLLSPCAAFGSDFSGKTPCIKRFPSENIPMLA